MSVNLAQRNSVWRAPGVEKFTRHIAQYFGIQNYNFISLQMLKLGRSLSPLVWILICEKGFYTLFLII
ncbi:MAG: hypothetical protein C0490_26690 [Marivirga sp.]|nr:hypothetical protein [Marivirga sp.]